MIYFKKMHPIVLLEFFLSILFLTMLTSNPLFLVISFVCALSVNALYQKPKTFWMNCLIMVILIMIITITNPLFNSSGETILFKIGNIPFAKESLLKGMSVGVMLGAIICWFNVFNEVMTTDKMYFLFGKFAPTITLILSMGFRFIPLMIQQMKKIEEGQKGLGLFNQTSFLKKVKHYLRIFSILVTWSLENALDTANAMKSRGFGLKPRTTFSAFSFRRNDLFSMIFILFVFLVISTGEFLNIYSFSFYPSMSTLTFGLNELLGYSAFLSLGLFPLFMAGKEAIIWHYWMLKI
ncbi:MAG: energy-coupling factor transporter transmembrane component T [Bacilli bacterium]